MNDHDLLRAYADHRSEAAFSSLVERHIGLVYSAALRQVRDPHLAQEITQTVFILLASKAHTLKKETVLAGWLYRTASFAACDLLKAQHRRQRREQLAFQMQTTSADDSGWEKVAPLLDEALAQLGTKDRDAVLLRFFDQKSLAEVGAALGANEEAARKRVARAVDKLRAIFVRRGCVMPVATIMGLLTAKAVHAAPLGLSSAISATAALSDAGLQYAGTMAAAKTLVMTTLQKTLIASAIAAAVGTGVYETRRASQWKAQFQTLQQQQEEFERQIQQLGLERDGATNQLAAARQASEELRRNTAEIPKLRGELARWRREALELAQAGAGRARPDADPTESAARVWAGQVKQLRKRVSPGNGSVPHKRILC